MKKDKLTFGIVLSIVFLLVIGVTYAYFSLVVTGNDTASNVVIEMGELSLMYSDGTQVIAHEIEPGWNYTKTVTVTNNGSSGLVYKMYYSTLLNEIYGEDSSTSNSEMHISATCMSSENTYCDGIEEKSVTYSNTETTNQIIKEDIYIAPGETQTYEITFKFINTNYNQNYNQGKSFYAQINVGDDTTMYNVNVTAYDGEDLIENFNYEMHSTPRNGSTTTGTFSESNVELGSHTVTLTSGSDIYTGSFDLRTSESKGQYSLTAYAEEGTNTADIILYFNADKELESIEVDGGNEKHPLRPIVGTLAQNWQVKAGYKLNIDEDCYAENDIVYCYDALEEDYLEASEEQSKAFIKSTQLQKIYFYDDGRTFDGISPIDVSEEEDGSVLLYHEVTSDCDQITKDWGESWITPDSCSIDHIVADGRIDFPVVSSYLFSYLPNTNLIDFNNSVNTSSVTNMSQMFGFAGWNAQIFILDLSGWNTSSVTNMSGMFESAGDIAQTFELDLSGWDTSNVTDMSSMFEYAGDNAQTFELDLSGWDTSNVTDMCYMFFEAGYSSPTFDIGDLSNWDTSNVTDMLGMFSGAGYSAQTFDIGNLSNWNVSNVTNMSEMFYCTGRNATTWNIGNLNNWNTSSVTNMSQMFGFAGWNVQIFILDLSGWNTSSVTNMSGMFCWAGTNANSFILDLSEWDVSNVTDMSDMFYNAGRKATTWNIGDISNWDTSKVTNMTSMFQEAGQNAETFELELSNWNTSKVTNMSYMFSAAGECASTFQLDLSNWNVSKVTDMSFMFDYAGGYATTWNIGNLSNWNTLNVTNMGNMFEGTGGNATTWNIGNLSNWNTSSVTNMSYMFNRAGGSAQILDIGDLSNWDTSKVTNMESMFSYAGYNATTWNVGDLSNWDTSNVTNMSWMFSDAGRKATYSLNLGGWSVPLVTSHSNFNSGVTSKVISPIWVN